MLEKIYEQVMKTFVVAMRRTRILYKTLDIEGAELFSGAAAFGCGLVLCLPGNYLETNPALVKLDTYAPEWVYTTLLISLGTLQIVACILGGHPSNLAHSIHARTIWLYVRLKAMLAGVFLWWILAFLITWGGGYLGTVFFTICCAACMWGSQSIAKRFIKNNETDALLTIREEVGRIEAKPTPKHT